MRRRTVISLLFLVTLSISLASLLRALSVDFGITNDSNYLHNAPPLLTASLLYGDNVSSIVDMSETTLLSANFVITVFNTTYSYRYSRNLFNGLARRSLKSPNILYGIISHANNRVQRDAIRASWSFGENAIFVLGGLLSDELYEEMVTSNDILLLEAEEDYSSGLTRKTMLLIQFFAKVYKSYNLDYLFKTDDDCYVNSTQIRMELKGRDTQTNKSIDYFGLARFGARPVRDKKNIKCYISRGEYPAQRFPPYAIGMGYAISKDFASCADEEIRKIRSSRRLVKFEDVATGALARRCSIKLSPAPWVVEYTGLHGGECDIGFPYEALKDGTVTVSIVHAVKAQYMSRIHKHLRLDKID